MSAASISSLPVALEERRPARRAVARPSRLDPGAAAPVRLDRFRARRRATSSCDCAPLPPAA
ncbi:hypothetical protein [Nocardioides mangrovi]|uniref:Uncharacterized protein n=1 Tax=Nocardioides mangrovi TaxID=2874580 RepID=A0ABS7UAR5_9ACTN|nr:hypothetical protein [Nocardioides mangrovi]MBZ5738093.1 hypothetical protein [Nocardioides mangrovi]